MQTWTTLTFLVKVLIVTPEEKVNPDGSATIIDTMPVNVKGALEIYRDIIQEYIIACHGGKKAWEDSKFEGMLKSYSEFWVLDQLNVKEIPLRER